MRRNKKIINKVISKESDFRNGLPVKFKSNKNRELIIMSEIYALILCLLTMFFLIMLILDFTFMNIILLLCSILLGVYFLPVLLSLKYSIILNSNDFIYKNIFFKGTVEYTDVEQLYIKRTPGKGSEDFYRIKIKLRTGKSLSFSLNCLQDEESELLKKVFRVKTKKNYIYKNSIF